MDKLVLNAAGNRKRSLTIVENRDDMVLHGPFNVVRAYKARMATLDNGMRAMVLEIRFQVPPEDTVLEATLLWEEQHISNLLARLSELSEREPHTRH